MPTFLIEKIRKGIRNFDILELGNSVVLYYILIYGMLPLMMFSHLPSKKASYFLSYGIRLLDARIFFYLLIGILFFILGYNFFYFKRLNEKIGKVFNKQWNPQKIFWVFIIVFLGSLLIKAIRVFGGGYFHLNKNPALTNSAFYSLIGFLDWLGPIALSIAFIYYFYLFRTNDSRYKIWRFIAWGIFIFEFVYGFFSGSRFIAIIPIIVYLIIKHYIYKPSFWRVVFAFILIFFFLMPVQDFYENPKSFLDSYTTKVDHQIKITPLAISQYTVDTSVGRVDQSWILKQVFEKTDKFLYGKTFKEFLTSLGPARFIWKNKPLSINAFGNEFGRELGILAPTDFKTSVGPTMLGDWYINFGIWGIVFGMFLMGGIFRLFYEILIRESGHSSSGIMIYSFVWIEVIRGMENWIAPVYAGLVKLFIILIIIHFFLTWKTKS